MIIIKMTIAYDGTGFLGWQKSREGPTIEENLTKTLEQIVQHPVALQAASRTDRGVHAEGQVISCQIKKKELLSLRKSLNLLLPPTIRVLEIQEAESDFHATLAAKGKTYHYHLYHDHICPPHLHRTHWHIYKPLNLEAMKEASHYFLGTHDFAAFCNQQENSPPKSTIRTLYQVDMIEESPHRLLIKVMGNRFLYKMVRNIVGLLVQIGQGKKKPSDVLAVIASKQRMAAGITAPAHGLTLKEVEYDRTK